MIYKCLLVHCSSKNLTRVYVMSIYTCVCFLSFFYSTFYLCYSYPAKKKNLPLKKTETQISLSCKNTFCEQSHAKLGFLGIEIITWVFFFMVDCWSNIVTSSTQKYVDIFSLLVLKKKLWTLFDRLLVCCNHCIITNCIISGRYVVQAWWSQICEDVAVAIFTGLVNC